MMHCVFSVYTSFPGQRIPVEHTSIKATKRDDERQTLIVRKREGHIEWHPVPDQVKAVGKDGMPH